MVLKNLDQYCKGKTFVYFVRHGERIHIPGKKESGFDIPGPGLTRKGRWQAKSVAKKFKKLSGQIDYIYSSHMTRAIETANEIAKVIKKKPIIIPEFSESHRLIWQKKFHSPKFWKHYLKYRSSLIKFNKILIKNKGKAIIVVGHANAIRGIIFKKLGLKSSQINRFDHDNCHLSLIRFDGKKLDYIHYYNSKDLPY